MPQPTPRNSGFGALLLAFVAGAIGGAAGALVVAPHAEPSAEEAGSAELRRSLAALDESIRALGEQVATLGRTPPWPDAPPVELLQPDTTIDPGVREFVAASQVVRQLEDHIAEIIKQSLSGSLSGFAGSGPSPVLRFTDASPNPAVLAPLNDEDHRAIFRRHAFWTCQQVLDAYGLPDQIETGDGAMGWYYDTGERTVHFVFYEGMLVNFWN